MTDLSKIDISTSQGLKEYLAAVTGEVKSARSEATGLRTALDEKLGHKETELKTLGSVLGDTKAKVDELVSKMTDQVGLISKAEAEIGTLREKAAAAEARAEEQKGIIERLYNDLKSPKSSGQTEEDLAKEVAHALDFFQAKQWQNIDGNGLDTNVKDLTPEFITADRLTEYRAGRAVIQKLFRMGKAVAAGRETDFLTKDETKSLSTYTMGNRYWLQTEMSNRIIACYRLDTDLTQFVDTLTISRGSIEMMTDHYVGQDAMWKAELDCQPKASATEPMPGTVIITANELVADECITHTMIEDSAVSVEQWLAQKVGGKFVRKINNSVLFGTGDKQPNGLLKANNHLTMLSGNVTGTPTGDFTWQDLVLMSIKLEPRFRKQAIWLFGTNALAATMTMTDAQGRPIWSAAVLNQEGLPRIMGKPVVEVTQMPDYLDGSGAKLVGSHPIALGDFKQAYMLVNRRGFTAMRDPYSMMQCGVRWHFSQRVGGDVLCRNASIFLEIR